MRGAARHIHATRVATRTEPTSIAQPSARSSFQVTRVASQAITADAATARPAPA